MVIPTLFFSKRGRYGADTFFQKATKGDAPGHPFRGNQWDAKGNAERVTEGTRGSHTPPIREDGRIELTHWSNRPGLKSLDPAHYGEGLKGAEAKRKTADPENWVDRTYHGIGVGTPEGYKREAGLGPHRYTSSVDASKLYDIAGDPAGIRPKTDPDSWANPISSYEKIIKDKGYEGYWVKTPNGFAAATFNPVTPEKYQSDAFKGDKPGHPFHGNQYSDAQRNFMADVHAGTFENFFDPRERVLNSQDAAVEVSPNTDGSIHLGSVRSFAIGKKTGAGNKALKFLTDLADKHRVTLEGVAKSFGSFRGALSDAKLKAWYKRNGFEFSHYMDSTKENEYMHREPKALKFNSNHDERGRFATASSSAGEGTLREGEPLTVNPHVDEGSPGYREWEDAVNNKACEMCKEYGFDIRGLQLRDESKTFTVGDVSYREGGSYTPSHLMDDGTPTLPVITLHPQLYADLARVQDVMAHELGHDEFHRVLDRRSEEQKALEKEPPVMVDTHSIYGSTGVKEMPVLTPNDKIRPGFGLEKKYPIYDRFSKWEDTNPGWGVAMHGGNLVSPYAASYWVANAKGAVPFHLAVNESYAEMRRIVYAGKQKGLKAEAALKEANIAPVFRKMYSVISTSARQIKKALKFDFWGFLNECA